MTTLLASASPVQAGYRFGDRRLAAVPVDSTGVARPDLIPVAAYLIVEGYQRPDGVLDRLAAGRSPHELVAAGFLEPADLVPVCRLILAAAAAPVATETDAEFLSRMRRQDAAEIARLKREYPLDANGNPAWDPARPAPVSDDADDGLAAFIRENPVPAVLPYHAILS